MGYVYCIENQINHKKYVGLTHNSIEARMKDHMNKMNRFDRPLYLAFRKHGIDNFRISLIEEVDNNVLNQREQYWIAHLNTYKMGTMLPWEERELSP